MPGVLLASVLALAYVFGAHDADRRRAEQRAAERATLTALRESVADVLARQAALARVVGTSAGPIGDRWPLLADIVMRHSPANSAGFVEPVDAVRRAAFEQRSGLRLVQASAPGVFARAARRPRHLVLTHFRQKTAPLPPLGLDLAADPLRSAMLLGAERAGRQLATPPLDFLVASSHRRGVIVFAPARDRRGRLRGWVTTSFQARSLAAQIAARTPGVHLSISDGGSVLVADRRAQGGTAATIGVAGRRWTARVAAAPGRPSPVAWIVLTLGVALSLVVSLVLRQSASKERYALALVAQRDAERDEAEADLRRSRRQLGLALESMADGLAIVTGDGGIELINGAAERILGAHPDGVHDPRWTIFDEHGVALAADRHPVVLAAATGEAQHAVLGVARPDGAFAWLEIDARLIDDAGDGSQRRVLCTFADVTSERARQAGIARDRAALAEAQAIARVGSWSWDPASEHAEWSGEMYRIFGRDPAAGPLLGDDLLACLHPDDRDRIAAAHAAAIGAGERFALESRIVRGGETRHLHAIGRRDAGGSYVGTVQDVTERKRREVEEDALRDLAELVAGSAGPDVLFAAVAERLGNVFEAASAAVVRYDRAEQVGIVQGGWARSGATFTGAPLALDGVSGSAVVFRTGRAARLETLDVSSADPACSLMATLGVSGGMAAPITVAGELWGSVGVAFAQDPVPPGGELRLERFARLLSMAIANADAWETLARQASTDAVTGLANTRTFHERLRSELKQARRHGRELGLVLLDLDHFKRVNDVHGHQAGDRVLAEVARRLAGEAREGELVARIGGEEFAWLMPDTSEAGAYTAAERARRAIGSVPFGSVGTLTLSAGLCSSAFAERAEELVRLADQALYQAKDRGRNTTVAYAARPSPDVARVAPTA